MTGTKKQKMKISNDMVDAIYSMEPPGRFLKKCPGDSEAWEELSRRDAADKAAQAMAYIIKGESLKRQRRERKLRPYLPPPSASQPQDVAGVDFSPASDRPAQAQDDVIPLDAGCLKPLRVTVAPEGCMRDPQPRPPGAGVTGNVETSMCVTNAIFGALGLMADSPCTMGNFTFGNARHQYDETIPGATMRSILPSKNELMRGSSCRSRGRRTVQPPMSTMRCSCPNK